MGIATGLVLKFGDERLHLLPEIEVLDAIWAAIKSVGSFDELRRVYRS